MALLAVVSGTACNAHSAASDAEDAARAPTEQTRASDQPPAFDVPSLIGKNIDQIRTRLGTPVDHRIEPPATIDTDEWSNEFHHDGRALLVTYNPKTRRVTDFFIGTDDSSGTTMDYLALLPVVHAVPASPAYRIEPVPALGASGYTGIKIVPTPQHARSGR